MMDFDKEYKLRLNPPQPEDLAEEYKELQEMIFREYRSRFPRYAYIDAKQALSVIFKES